VFRVKYGNGERVYGVTPGDLEAFVQRHDWDRYFCTLFAPAGKREALLVLYAFNHEISRAVEVASEPGLALIRLQWWRDVVEGAQQAHEVAGPVRAALAHGDLRAEALLQMIEARENALETDESVENWKTYLSGRGGELAREGGRVLGADARQIARLAAIGTAYAGVGELRNWANAKVAPQVRLVPQEVLVPGEARDSLLEWLAANLHTPAQLGDAIAAGLVGVFAKRDLKRLAKPALPRGIGDRLAVVWAARRQRG